jgi:hypothetical protein
VIHHIAAALSERHRSRLRAVIDQAKADIAYYGDSDDPMSMGRAIGARELLRIAVGERAP